jgi:hypothetical protein
MINEKPHSKIGIINENLLKISKEFRNPTDKDKNDLLSQLS